MALLRASSLLLCLSCVLLPACGLSRGDFDGEGEGEGPEAGGETCDAGECAPADGDLTCGTLIDVTCGTSAECSEDPGCVAATLLAEFRPAECSAAILDVRSYPRCTTSSCDDLVARVCGIGGECQAASACGPAQQLRERADSGASCAAALTDQTLFPQCQ